MSSRGAISRRRRATEPFSGGDGAPGRALSDLLRKNVVTVRADEPLRVVVHRMAETGRTRLPVVDADDQSRLVGLVTLKDLLKARTRHLEEETRRERVLPLGALVPFARFMTLRSRNGKNEPPSRSTPSA